jgi:hypothetical protein
MRPQYVPLSQPLKAGCSCSARSSPDAAPTVNKHETRTFATFILTQLIPADNAYRGFIPGLQEAWLRCLEVLRQRSGIVAVSTVPNLFT